MCKIDGDNSRQVESNEPFDKNLYEKQILEEVMPVIKNPKDKIVLDKSISNLNEKFWNFNLWSCSKILWR